MPTKRAASSAEMWRIATAHAGEHGFLAREMLYKIGYSRHQIDHLLVANRLEPTEDVAIYRLPNRPTTWQSRLAAFSLKSGGIASHLSAAMLHGLGSAQDLSPGFAEVIVPSGRRVRSGRYRRVYESAGFDESNATTKQGIRCTPVEGTLLDIAATYDLQRFRACANEAFRTRATTLERVRNVSVGQEWRKKGSRRVSDCLEAYSVDEIPLSDWSNWAADLCVAHGIPRPILEFRILNEGGRLLAQVDLCWPEARLVVELDGFRFHSNEKSFETDRSRDAALSIRGYAVLRFTWSQYQDTKYFIEIIRAALARRS